MTHQIPSKFDKEDLSEKNIVVCECGNSIGTAFFISDTQLLTARHIVIDALAQVEEDGTPITPIRIYVDDSHVFDCLVKESTSEDRNKLCDVVLLTLKTGQDWHCSKPLRLLSSEYSAEESLTIKGFPTRIGQNKLCINLKVNTTLFTDETNRPNYDTVVYCSDDFSLSSYEGYSGSPVINDSGLVVGIATRQMDRMIGFLSINYVKECFGDFISVNPNSAEYNPFFGRERCRKLLIKSIATIKNRYNQENPRPNETLERMIDIFVQDKQKYENIAKSFIEAYCKLLKPQKKKVKDGIQDFPQQLTIQNVYNLFEQYGSAESPTPFYELHKLASPIKVTGFRGRYRTIYAIPEIENLYKFAKPIHANYRFYNLSQKQFFCLYGTAGSGKTHLMCFLAEKIIEKENWNCVFLLFGHEFSGAELPIDIICKKCGFSTEKGNNKSLNEFNDFLTVNNKYAIFFIDALNEGAGEGYWTRNERLTSLRESMSQYSRFRIIISIRSPYSNLINQSEKSFWHLHELTGFDNPKEDIEYFLEQYGILEHNKHLLHYPEFSNPLYLLTYCKTYKYLNREEKEDLKITNVYHKLLESHNIIISNQVDADPCQGIVDLFIHKFTEMIIQKNGMDLSRDDAREISDSICPNRLWSKSLLQQMLVNNILISYHDGEEYKVTFDYELMGNFLCAEVITNNSNDEEIKNKLIELSKNSEKLPNRQKIEYIITCVLAIWEFESIEIIQNEIAFRENETLRKCLILSLRYRREDNLKRKIEVIKYLGSNNLLAPRLFLDEAIVSVDELHSMLSSLTEDEFKIAWSDNIGEKVVDISYGQMHSMLMNYFPANPNDCITLCVWLLCTGKEDVRDSFINCLSNMLSFQNDRYLKKKLFPNRLLNKFTNIRNSRIITGLLYAISKSDITIFSIGGKKNARDTHKKLIRLYNSYSIKNEILVYCLQIEGIIKQLLDTNEESFNYFQGLADNRQE